MLLGRSLDDHLVETVLITAFHRPAAIDALHEDFDIAVGKLQRLQNVRDRPDGIDVGRTRVVRGRVVLGCEEDPAIVRERVFERAEDDRPMTKGIIIYGKITTSRKGTIGSVSWTSARSLLFWPNISVVTRPWLAPGQFWRPVGARSIWFQFGEIGSPRKMRRPVNE